MWVAVGLSSGGGVILTSDNGNIWI
jgi:hypothetical protein